MNLTWEGRDLLSGIDSRVLRSSAEARCRRALRRGADGLPGRGRGGRRSRSACCSVSSFRGSSHSRKEVKNCRALANDRYVCINFKGDSLCGTLGYLFLVMIVFSYSIVISKIGFFLNSFC